MPITKTTGYIDSAGAMHATVEEAQRAELEEVFKPLNPDEPKPWGSTAIAERIIKCSDAILAILTTGPTSRPSARKRAGTTSPKRAAKRATEAQASQTLGKALRTLMDDGASPASGEQAKAGFKTMRQAAEGGTNGAHDADVPVTPVTA